MATASSQLDSFINSSDSQINQIVPPQIATSRKITNILDTGILSSAELIRRGLAFAAGYDVVPSEMVYLNLITKVEGIALAALSPADGIFAIGMERNNDEAFINGLIKTEQLDQKFQEKLLDLSCKSIPIPPYMHSMIKETVKHTLLAQNSVLLETLYTRIQNTAVFVLDVEPNNGDKLDDNRGCHDAVRTSIPANKIRTILISQEWRDSAEIASIISNRIKPVIFVPNIAQEVTYTYKSDGVKTIKVQLSIPDYQTALTRIFREQFEALGKPMFIHAARI